MTELSTADRLAIGETLAAYCHNLDRGRWQEFAALFTADCRLDLSQVLGCYEGSQGIEQFCDNIRSAGICMRHLVTNMVVRGDGDRARVESYVLAMTGAAGNLHQTTGFYDDELVRRDGRWLLHRRTLTLDLPPR